MGVKMWCQNRSKIDSEVQKSASEAVPESHRFWDAFRKHFGEALCASSTVNTIWFVTSALLQKVPFRISFGRLLGNLLASFGRIFRFQSRLKKSLKKRLQKVVKKIRKMWFYTIPPGRRIFDLFWILFGIVFLGRFWKMGGTPPIKDVWQKWIPKVDLEWIIN